MSISFKQLKDGKKILNSIQNILSRFTKIEENLEILNNNTGGNIEEKLESKADLNKSNTFLGEQFINNNLHVSGSIIQNGVTYETHVEKIYSKNDLIHTREGSISGLDDFEFTGMVAINYDGENNGLLVFDNKGTARVGDENDTQPLLTRSEEEYLQDGDLFVWNSEERKAIPSRDYIRKTEFANSDKGGLVKVSPNFGIDIDYNTKYLYFIPATKEDINGKKNNRKVLVPENIDCAVLSSTIQNMTDSDENDLNSINVSSNFISSDKGKLPVSYNAIKNYLNNLNLDVDISDTVLNRKEDIINKVNSINENSTDIQYPSAKAVYISINDIKDDIKAIIGEDFINDSTGTEEIIEWEDISSNLSFTTNAWITTKGAVSNQSATSLEYTEIDVGEEESITFKLIATTTGQYVRPLIFKKKDGSIEYDDNLFTITNQTTYRREIDGTVEITTPENCSKIYINNRIDSEFQFLKKNIGNKVIVTGESLSNRINKNKENIELMNIQIEDINSMIGEGLTSSEDKLEDITSQFSFTDKAYINKSNGNITTAYAGEYSYASIEIEEPFSFIPIITTTATSVVPIIFKSSSGSFTYDTNYTGTSPTRTYDGSIVVEIPSDCKTMYINKRTTLPFSLKRIYKGNANGGTLTERILKNESRIIELENNPSSGNGNSNFSLQEAGRKLIESNNLNPFKYKTLDKGYISFVFDDTKADIGAIYKLFLERNIPCCFATIPSKLDTTTFIYNGVQTNARDFLLSIQNVSGDIKPCEILAHNGSILTDLDKGDLDKHYKIFVDTKQKLIDAGFKVRGIIKSGGTATDSEGNVYSASTADLTDIEPWARLFYDYSDTYGKTEPYCHERKPITSYSKAIENVNNAINNKKWISFMCHGFIGQSEDSDHINGLGISSPQDLTYTELVDLLDYIVSQGETVQVITYNDFYEKFKSNTLNETIGDIDSALDEIISLGDSLNGGETINEYNI